MSSYTITAADAKNREIVRRFQDASESDRGKIALEFLDANWPLLKMTFAKYTRKDSGQWLRAELMLELMRVLPRVDLTRTEHAVMIYVKTAIKYPLRTAWWRDTCHIQPPRRTCQADREPGAYLAAMREWTEHSTSYDSEIDIAASPDPEIDD